MTKSNGSSMGSKDMDDMFNTEKGHADVHSEKVQCIPMGELHPFPNHPFKITDDEDMNNLVSSIKENGILEPVIARPIPNGGYELISGHRRFHACKQLGWKFMPTIVRSMDYNTAVLLMVDSNLQHRELSLSEKAFAYKMRLDAIKHQGARTDLTSGQLVQKSALQQVADDIGENYKQVQRIIHLTNLNPRLLEMADNKQIAFMTAYDLSFLKPGEQKELVTTMDQQAIIPNLQQAKRIKECSQESALSTKVTKDILNGNDVQKPHKLVIPIELVGKFFPDDWARKEMMQTIVQLLEKWHESQNA